MPTVVPCVVTGHVQDEGGNLATAGTVEFILQPFSTSLPYRIVNTAVLAPIKVFLPISPVLVSGFNLSGNVWGNDQITPAGTTYQVIFHVGGYPTVSTQPTLTVSPQIWDGVYIFGSNYNLDSPTFAPPRVADATVVTPTSVVPNNLMPAADNAFNIGSEGLRWASVHSVAFFGGSAKFSSIVVGS